MRILIKYIIKSMLEKKFRSFLIILAIALAGGLFLASSRLSANIGDAYYAKLTAAWGKSDISIYPNEDSPTGYISLSHCNKIDEAEHIVPNTYTGAEYKVAGEDASQYIQIQGYNIEDFLAVKELSVLEGSIENFSDTQIILTKNGADRLGVKVGDELKLNINGMRKITVVAIIDNTGAFENEGNNIQSIMPFDTICKYMKTNGRAGYIDIVLKEDANLEEVIGKIQKLYPKYTVEATIDKQSIEDTLSQITSPFMLMTLIVVFMSVFIIYSSFKVIMLEKLPIVGTFRSVGATKGAMNGVLLLEALFYGIIGGLAACVLGLGALYVLSTIMISMLMGDSMKISLYIPMSSYITAFLIGLVMALLSTILPILSVSKISLKDIILNNRPHKNRKYLKGIILGLALIVLGFTVAHFIQGNLAMLTAMTGLFIIIIGIIKLLPVVVLYTSQVIGIIFRLIFGNIGELATKNIKQNSSVINSITLITIGISILFAISTMTRNVNDQVVDFYKNTFKADIMCSMGDMDNQKLRILKRNENIVDVIEDMEAKVKIEEFDDLEVDLEAFQTTQLSPTIVYNLKGDEQALLQKVQDGRNIILTEFLKNKYKIEVGDAITIKFEKDSRQYKVVGFMNTICNNGYMGLTSIKYLKKDTGKTAYDTAYITIKDGADADEVCEQIVESFENITWTNAMTIEWMAKMNQESNASLMSMISIFAILAMLIGIVGVINNLMISFIERKQSIAMLRSVGMSKWQVLKMIFIEGIGSGLIGASCGLAGGILTCYSLGYVLKAMDQIIEMTIVPELFLSYFLGGMFITVIGSIIPARGSSKLNIIEAIKYE